MTDSDILALVAEDNERGFRALMETHQAMVVNLAYAYFGQREEAEDIAQTVFLKVYRNLASFKKQAKLSTWLYRITINACHDEARRKTSMKSVSADPHELTIASEDKSLEARERDRMVQEAIERLPEKHRDVVILKDFEGLAYKEIAEVLGCKIGTVESRLFRARQQLKTTLTPLFAEGGLL